MQNIKITAKLSVPIGVSDDWSPDLPSLLEVLWFRSNNCGEADSDPAKLKHAPIPLQMRILEADLEWNRTEQIISATNHSDLPNNWYWAASAPCYEIAGQSSMQVRKRQDPQTTGCLSNRSHKWDSSTGHLKNYDLPILTRTTPEISWFAVGDLEGVRSLLSHCTSLGKKTAAGLGAVDDWVVEAIDYDYSLVADGQLMRPVPVGQLAEGVTGFSVRNWVWRPCPKDQLMHWRELCALPTTTVKYANTERNALAVGAATAV